MGLWHTFSPLPVSHIVCRRHRVPAICTCAFKYSLADHTDHAWMFVCVRAVLSVSVSVSVGVRVRVWVWVCASKCVARESARARERERERERRVRVCMYARMYVCRYVCMYRETDAVPSHKAPGRRGILERGLRGGGPGRPPFWRTLVSPTEKWAGPGVLKNKHSTHTRSHERQPKRVFFVLLRSILFSTHLHVWRLGQRWSCTLSLSLSLSLCYCCLASWSKMVLHAVIASL